MSGRWSLSENVGWNTGSPADLYGLDDCEGLYLVEVRGYRCFYTCTFRRKERVFRIFNGTSERVVQLSKVVRWVLIEDYV